MTNDQSLPNIPIPTVGNSSPSDLDIPRLSADDKMKASVDELHPKHDSLDSIRVRIIIK
jgi:hypothetical protein